MKRKSPHMKSYLNLWNEGTRLPKRIDFIEDRRTSLLKKTIDSICLKADLAEDVNSYTVELIDGVIHLYSLGFRPSEVITHKILLQKLLSLGRDILEKTHQCDDLFYLGAFIDLKITQKWKDLSFYQFLSNALSKISNGIKLFSEKIKNKISHEYELFYPKEYDLFFTLPLDSSA